MQVRLPLLPRMPSSTKKLSFSSISTPKKMLPRWSGRKRPVTPPWPSVASCSSMPDTSPPKRQLKLPTLLTPAQMSHSDLFDVSNGTVVTNWSGRGTDSVNSGGTSCGEFSTTTKYPPDMFNGSGGSPCRATVFADNQPLGTEHRIEWKTPRPVTVQSLGLFAAHDQIRLKRSFSSFNFYVRKDGKWLRVKQFSPRGLSPTVIYGGSCGLQPCFPPPAQAYAP